MFLSPVYIFRRLAYQSLLHRSDDGAGSPAVLFELRRKNFQENCLSWLRKLRPYAAGMSLAIALASIACASIFIVIAATSMRPEAIAFDRLFIAGIAFWFWQYWTSQSRADCLTHDASNKQPTTLRSGQTASCQEKQPQNPPVLSRWLFI
ncbi:MAG: hypothetical protein AAFW75_30390, partial [Cyanobacteria bacterium J06636_16]